MRVVSIALFPVLLALGVAAKAAEPRSLNSLLEPLPHCMFDWVAEKDAPRSSINVPIEVGGQTLTWQLDTGADVSIL
jgi:hypothetical protein